MKTIIKLFLSFVIAAPIFYGCSSTKNSLKEQAIQLKAFQRDEYVILDDVKGQAKSFRFWLLFIPFGGTDDKILYDQAYSDAVKSAADQDADGLLEPRYSYKKTTVPLLIVTWTTKKVTAEGKAFRLKSEAEYQQSKASKPE